MKTFLLFPLFFLMFAAGNTSNQKLNQINNTWTDSLVIQHKLDGDITEWPADKFSTDKETAISYATDNDSLNLYLALNIPGPAMQMKMARMGMKLFIDLKGKKKENMGVEFPIKRESNGMSGGNSFRQGDGNGGQGGFDREQMKRTMTIYMIQMKLFGFGEEEPVAQQLELPGSVQIGFNWDSLGKLNIEYCIPLVLIGKISSLQQKTISLGWKINGVEIPSGSSGGLSGIPTTTTSSQGRTPPPSARRVSNSGNANIAEMGKMMDPQSFWTKFTFNIPGN